MATNVSYHRPTWQITTPTPAVTIMGILGFMTLIGVAAGIARLFAGLGMTTSLSDSVSWGIWIGFDFTMIALAGSGFTIAFVGHILHLHRFEAAVRPALFAGFLLYTGVLLILVLDLGRPDRDRKSVV